MYVKVDEDTVVTENGVEIRKTEPANEWWLEYEAWAAENAVPEKFTAQQWEALNDNARMRLQMVKPA